MERRQCDSFRKVVYLAPYEVATLQFSEKHMAIAHTRRLFAGTFGDRHELAIANNQVSDPVCPKSAKAGAPQNGLTLHTNLPGRQIHRWQESTRKRDSNPIMH